MTEKPGWLNVGNPNGKAISFFPIDGDRNVFLRKEIPLPVNDESRFCYQRTKLDSATQTQIVETKSVGRCECLLLDERWRFFEFKTDAGIGNLSAVNNRAAAEMQLARTMTFFREKAVEKGIGKIDAVFEGVIVTKANFPRFSGSLIDRGEEFRLKFEARLIEITTEDSYIIE